MSRRWPVPALKNTLHIVGDTQGISEARKALVLADLGRPGIPDVAHRIQVGDFTLFGQPAQFPVMKTFVDALGTGDWWACVGNHDVEPNNPPTNPNGGGLTPEQAAAYIGMPAKNFSVDLGYAVIVGLYVNTNLHWGEETPDTAWLDTELTQYAGRTVFIFAHTLLVGGNAGADLPTVDDAAWKTVIAAHPCVKAWIGGHSHFGPDRVNMTNTLTIGGRQVFTLDAGALHYTVPFVVAGAEWDDPLWSVYLTVFEDRLEARFRDHGAHQWFGIGPTQQKLVTFALT